MKMSDVGMGLGLAALAALGVAGIVLQTQEDQETSSKTGLSFEDIASLRGAGWTTERIRRLRQK